ncbi:blastula protease 10 [Caerostris extrusa]|uniref:Metalloendopeptidase n=1 Tax=Caerostris extrusa TaxID=172846 RepID=A0AAV4SAI3_CAEEX|nr:blastula protease 10 [Caerostris extrusa]
MGVLRRHFFYKRFGATLTLGTRAFLARALLRYGSNVVLEWVLLLLVNQVKAEPIDGSDDVVPLSDMDILTETNPLITDDGEPLVEGDMVLPVSDNEDENTVDDELKPPVNRDTRAKIRLAMDEWENRTCLRFHETLIDFNYLRFRTDKGGCWSLVGRQNRLFSGQDVSIGPGCDRVRVIVHEIGHAIGMFHEQSRVDRDGYVTILWQNIPSGMTSQFSTNMDYPRGWSMITPQLCTIAFTKQLFQKNTIVTKNPHYQRLIGSGQVISFRDAKLANKMYSCNSFCPKPTQ